MAAFDSTLVRIIYALPHLSFKVQTKPKETLFRILYTLAVPSLSWKIVQNNGAEVLAIFVVSRVIRVQFTCSSHPEFKISLPVSVLVIQKRNLLVLFYKF